MRSYAVAIGLLVLIVAVVYGRSVTRGLLLDDYNHRAELREADGSFRSLVQAAHLGSPGRRVRMWWQHQADLYFFRPLAFFLIRLEYVIGGWRPAVMHLFSLGWAVVGAVLVMRVAGRVTGNVRWGGLAGVLFAMHPANQLTVRWVACQNEQMAAAFILGGLLLYGRYSGWRWSGTGEAREGGFVYLAGALACFVAALGCRETGVILAPLLVAGDVAVRRAGAKQRWGVYVVLAGILVGYLVIRHIALGGFRMPGSPYAWPMGKPGFGRFVVDKFIYYMLGLFACFPIVGFGGLRGLRAEPILFYGTFAVIAVVWAFLLWACRRRRVLGLWLLLAVLPLLPVLSVFASSHHLYLASAGAVVATVTAARWIMERAAARESWGGKLVRGGVAVLMAVCVIAFAGAGVFHDAGMAGFSAASQLPVDEVVRRAGPMRPGDRLFFINLPMLGFNCIPGIEEATGVRPLTGYALTFSPSLLAMDRPGYVTRLGENQLCVGLEGGGYFSGLSGQSMLEAVGRDQPFAVGETFRAEDFEVKVVRAGDKGVNELVFTFDRPLDDPTYHFFFGSPLFSAYPLRFD